MYIVINFASAGLTIAGVFTTLSNAQQYIGQQSAGQQSAGSFFICQVQSLPGGGPTNIVSPIPISAGQFTVCVSFTDAFGNSQFVAYGNFATLAAAQQYIFSRDFPGGCAAAVVGTAGF